MNYQADNRQLKASLQKRYFASVLLKSLLVLVVIIPTSQALADKSVGAIRIAAASSLQFALNEAVENYRTSLVANIAAPDIQIVYGSSGNLYRQIVQGAPFDLFFSADASLIDKLHEQGITKTDGAALGHGRLVLAMTDRAAEEFSAQSADLALTALASNGGSFRLAIANPVHAPYGKAAKQLIDSLDLWDQLKSKLVYGEKVSQATQFVTSGAVDFAIISLSLALAVDVSYVEIEVERYHPIAHKMVLLDENEDHVASLYRYLADNSAVAEVFEKYGYVR